jgi:hypothetical protein
VEANVLMLTDDELRATVRAGRRWAAERDIPDPVGWADLAFAVDATVAVIRGRTGSEYARRGRTRYRCRRASAGSCAR